MRKHKIKYIISILLIVFLAYNSVYFKKLDEVKSVSSSPAFDAAAFARNLYDNQLLPRVDSAVELSTLIPLLSTDPAKAFSEYSRALAIGNIRYFLVQGTGTIASIGDDAAVVVLNDSARSHISIATEFVYGNAIRDASGLVNLNDFANTAEVNSISENINIIVRSEVLPAFNASAREGSEVKFKGAIELNQRHVDLHTLEIVPIQLSIK